VLTVEEKDKVLIYIRSYLGSARCGLVDRTWTAEQQEYGNDQIAQLIHRLDLRLSPEHKGK
jgi:hypothetical protein